MLDVDQIRKGWSLLRAPHPLFSLAESLPTVEDAEKGEYDEVPMDYIHNLKNDITLLRTDFKINIIKQDQIDIDQLEKDENLLQRLQTALQTLFGELENLIDAQIEEGQETEFTGSMLSSFPRLVALHRLLQSPCAAELHDTLDGSVSTGAESPCGRQPYPPSMTRAASYIRFPQEPQQIYSYQRSIISFGSTLQHLGKSMPSCSTAVQATECTSKDVAVIQDAHDFALACTSLFAQMVDRTKCDTPHQAKLHLSGFPKDQVTMNIGTCQDAEWQSVQFAKSFNGSAEEAIPFDYMCSPIPPSYQAPENETLRIAFDAQSMWIYPVKNRTTREPNNRFRYDQYVSLDSLINQQIQFTPKYRKLIGALLAGSFFRLGDSPWIEQHLERDKIFVPLPDDKRIRQWFPRIDCTLATRAAAISQSEQIAALGVLILELEANCKAEWIEADKDLETRSHSNTIRLARILTDWQDLVTDNYRAVARACLDFKSLVDDLDHQDINPDIKHLAVTFKFIFEPLWRNAVKSFSALRFVFQGLFDSERWIGLTKRITPTTTAKRVLFDDDEGSHTAEQQASAKRFIGYLEPFCNRIGALRGLEENIRLTNQPEKVRIAVLDSGVDYEDTMVWSAIKQGRINGSKSRNFVGQFPDDWRSDTHGHGTHITRLLLKTAPAAEVYVGKICTGKLINGEFTPGIVKAINWAVECDVDIISMSFGFDEEDEKIDDAVDGALLAGKLIFAAASNNGALSKRARPARYDGVICIHASDGMGNKGSMNPTPVLKRDNFSTLGVAVPSRWKSKEVWKSGTSFATPIAAGLAANVLEFTNYKCLNLGRRKAKLLRQQSGMQAIFRAMTEVRDHYDFIHPKHLWGDWGVSGNAKAEQDAVRTIEKIMQEM